MPSLMDLPFELREIIYEYILVDEEGFDVSIDAPEPGLLAVSRQIRQESIPFFYGSKSVVGMSCKILPWLKSLGESGAKILREVHVEMEWASSIEHIRSTFQACTDRIVNAAGGETVIAKDVVKFPLDDYRHGLKVQRQSGEDWQWASCSELDGMKLAEMSVCRNTSISVFRRESEVNACEFGGKTTFRSGNNQDPAIHKEGTGITLPRELRDIIYEYALQYEHRINWSVINCNKQPPSLQASPVSRREATPVFYGVNTFSGCFGDVLLRLQCLDATRIKMIRTIKVVSKEHKDIHVCADRLVRAAGGSIVLAEDVLTFPVQVTRPHYSLDLPPMYDWFTLRTIATRPYASTGTGRHAMCSA